MPHCISRIANLLVIVAIGLSATAAAGAGNDSPTRADYRQAYAAAKEQQKMLLVLFRAEAPSQTALQLDRSLAEHEQSSELLERFVVVRLPLDHRISTGDEKVRIVDHPAFAEMHGREGVAIVDLAHADADYYGYVVSAFPVMRGKYYDFRPEHLATVLQLPPGTLTQRSMVYAVRIHPERPQSTSGSQSETLTTAAQSHSLDQASRGVQGHHRWESRFHQLRAQLKSRTPVEVVAESWPNQTMIDSCVDCVRSWRFSSGHWSAVSRSHALYGYDIRRGGNGIWYGTGIFAD